MVRPRLGDEEPRKPGPRHWRHQGLDASRAKGSERSRPCSHSVTHVQGLSETSVDSQSSSSNATQRGSGSCRSGHGPKYTGSSELACRVLLLSRSCQGKRQIRYGDEPLWQRGSSLLIPCTETQLVQYQDLISHYNKIPTILSRLMLQRRVLI